MCVCMCIYMSMCLCIYIYNIYICNIYIYNINIYIYIIFVQTNSATKIFAGFEQRLCLLAIIKTKHCKNMVFVRS